MLFFGGRARWYFVVGDRALFFSDRVISWRSWVGGRALAVVRCFLVVVRCFLMVVCCFLWSCVVFSCFLLVVVRALFFGGRVNAGRCDGFWWPCVVF